MDYLVKIRSVQTPLNGQFSIGANMGSCDYPYVWLSTVWSAGNFERPRVGRARSGTHASHRHQEWLFGDNYLVRFDDNYLVRLTDM